FESLAINKKQARQFQFFFLIRSAKAAPQSSLSHMIGVLDERLAEGRGRYYYSKEGLEFDLLLRDLSSCSKKVFLFATSSALLEFLQRVKLRKTFLKLAPDSRFFETGGFKAASRRVSRERVDALCLKHLSLKAADRVGEFGMTEMFSQFYSRGAACVFKGPPWARCVARLPSVAKEAPPGRAGVLSFCDLANLDSVIALQTEDRGFIRAGGFEYLGRIPQAARRGCSLDYAGFVR
ncbi:MAG: hypothetical protein WCG06_05745, partial [Candidatus Omnitrophota bacterium]